MNVQTMAALALMGTAALVYLALGALFLYVWARWPGLPEGTFMVELDLLFWPFSLVFRLAQAIGKRIVWKAQGDRRRREGR